MKHLSVFISSMLAYLLIGIITIFVAENISNISYNRQTLFDFVHYHIPQFPDPSIPDAAVALAMCYMIVRWWHVDLRIPSIYFYALTGMMFVRLFTFTITQTPPPRRLDDKWRINHCKRTVLKHLGISFSKISDTCIDNMFSGHAATLVSALCVILFFSKNIIEKVIASIFVTLTTIAIITSRMHYSSDVIVATVFSILSVWLLKSLVFGVKG